MKVNTFLILVLIALGVLYYFYFNPVNSFVRTTLHLQPQNDFEKQLTVNDSNFIYYNDFEHGFSFKYPIGYYVIKKDDPEIFVSLIHFGSYGDVEYFAIQQYTEDLKTKFASDIPYETPKEITVQGRKGYFSQSFTGDAILRNFYFTCSNKNYLVAARIPSSFAADSDLYYYFIKNFNCDFK